MILKKYFRQNMGKKVFDFVSNLHSFQFKNATFFGENRQKYN
jgi:hypothetical protein